MNTKKHILFFPFTQNSYPLLHMLSNNFSEIKVASYKGSGLIGKDIGYAINNSIEEGIIVENVFDVNLNDIKKLVILDTNFDEMNFEHILKLISQINNLGVEIMILSNHINDKFKNYERIDGIRKYVHEINKPIIFVAGIYDTVFNSLTTLEIKRRLSEKDIKSSVLSFDANLSYLNCCSCRLSLIDSMSLPNAVYYLKIKIQELLNADDIDTLIIQIPCGIVQLNEKHFNDFGIYYTLFSDIASPDYIVCNLPYDYYEEETIRQLNDIIKYKTHNSGIDSILLNNYYMKTNDPISLSANKDIIYLPKRKMIENNVVSREIKAIIKRSYAEITDDIIKKLGGKNENE